MRRTSRPHDHGQARVARRVLGALGAAAVLAAAQPAIGASEVRVKLPTEADATPFAPRSECLLNGKNSGLPSALVRGCLETRLPGVTTDDERVTVSMGTIGEPVGVTDVQRIVVTGLGDFSFKVPGPAFTVEGLPGSQEQPGLRKGAVLWQGFSPGRKVLGARMELHPNLEAARLPLRFELSITVGGEELQPDRRRSGPLRMSIAIHNESLVPVRITRARADPGKLARVLDAIHGALERRERPRPGDSGIPESISGSSPTSAESVQLEAPFAVSGTVEFPAGSVTGLRVKGGAARAGAITFATELGGGAPLTHEVSIEGTAHDLRLPSLEVAASPAPPLETAVAPPGGGTWSQAASAGHAEGGEMFSLAQTTLWRVALLRPFDAYVGNPDPTGPARTSYRFVLAPREEVTTSSGLTPSGLKPIGVLWFALVGLALLFGLAFAWARA